MLADEPAHGRERIRLTDDAHRIREASRRDAGDVARDIHMGGTPRLAGDAPGVRRADALLDVRDVVVVKGHETVQDEFRRLKADRTVRRIVDRLRRLLDQR